MAFFTTTPSSRCCLVVCNITHAGRLPDVLASVHTNNVLVCATTKHPFSPSSSKTDFSFVTPLSNTEAQQAETQGADDAAAAPAPVEDDEPQTSASQRKKEKRNKKKKGKGNSFDDEDEKDFGLGGGLPGADGVAGEEEVADEAPAMSASQRKKEKRNKKKQSKQTDVDEEGDAAVGEAEVEEEEEEEVEEEQSAAAKSGKAGGFGALFAASDDGDDDADAGGTEDAAAQEGEAPEAAAAAEEEPAAEVVEEAAPAPAEDDAEAPARLSKEDRKRLKAERKAAKQKAAGGGGAPAEEAAAPAAVDPATPQADVAEEEEQAGGAAAAPVADPDPESEPKPEAKAKAEAAPVKLTKEERKRLKAERKAAKKQALVAAEQPAEKGRATDLDLNFTLTQRVDPANLEDGATNIKVDAFSLSARGKELFVNAELHIVAGRKYGVLGPNGHGKTTLLRHIAERKFHFPANIDILLCEQEVAANELGAFEAVLSSDEKRTELLEEEKRLLAASEAGDPDVAGEKTIQEQLTDCYDNLRAIGADAAPGRARKILNGLGFTNEMMERPTNQFSGGWRMRVSLARALFIEPTCLILDEPTNHLDLNAVIWLDDYLSKWKKTLLIVSHDQDFLDNVCTDMVHVEMRKLDYYRGNYSSFKKMQKQKRREYEKKYKKQQDDLKRLKSKGQSKKSAEAKVKKDPNSRMAKGKKKGAQKGQQDDAVEEDTSSDLLQRYREYVVNFDFVDPPKLSPPILGISEVSFKYTPDADWLFQGLEFGIDMNSRIAIVGNNGVGKSTFLKLLTGENEPTVGRVERNHKLKIGVFNQHSAEILGDNESPAEYLQRVHDMSIEEGRRNLGRFGLEKHAHTIPMRDLSGGQKARVAFADLANKEPDILILDEPTNNLDLESIDALIDALQKFEGAVILVSHDARLICEAECELYECADQAMTKFNGEFYDYRQMILDRLDDDDVEEVEGRRVDVGAAVAARQAEAAGILEVDDGTDEVWG